MTQSEWVTYLSLLDKGAVTDSPAEHYIRHFFPFGLSFNVQFDSAYDYFLEINLGKRLWDDPSNKDARWEWFNGPIFKYENDAIMFALGFNNNA
jgi:hypothetical protein